MLVVWKILNVLGYYSVLVFFCKEYNCGCCLVDSWCKEFCGDIYCSEFFYVCNGDKLFWIVLFEMFYLVGLGSYFG